MPTRWLVTKNNSGPQWDLLSVTAAWKEACVSWRIMMLMMRKAWKKWVIKEKRHFTSMEKYDILYTCSSVTVKEVTVWLLWTITIRVTSNLKQSIPYFLHSLFSAHETRVRGGSVSQTLITAFPVTLWLVCNALHVSHASKFTIPITPYHVFNT